MRVGVIPIGLADGLQSLNCGQVLVRGVRAPIIGRPSLEHTRLDVSDVEGASVGDEVVLIGQQGGKEIGLQEVVGKVAGMTPLELALAVRESIRRVYLRHGSEVRGSKVL